MATRPSPNAALRLFPSTSLNYGDIRRQAAQHIGVVGRQAGRVDGFRYSAGFAKADFVWDEAKLNTWLTNPQELIPGAEMAYRQPKPETRTAIIAYLKELN